MPFLLIKKPQSPFIGGLIRYKNKVSRKRLDQSARLVVDANLGDGEDRWDEIVQQQTQQNVDGGDGGDAEGAHSSWAQIADYEYRRLQKLHLADAKKAREVALKMTQIVEAEKKLAAEEEEERQKESEGGVTRDESGQQPAAAPPQT